jgi:hypothetical protein
MMRAFYKIKNNTCLTANYTHTEKEGEERERERWRGSNHGSGFDSSLFSRAAILLASFTSCGQRRITTIKKDKVHLIIY